jgi:NitT/TauT family transport system substrate-binding protein
MRVLLNLAYRSAILAVILLLMSCSHPSTPALMPVTVQLSWTHQSQFAGFYAAEKKGYYADEGLTVTFIEGGPNISIPNAILDGAVDFGVLPADVAISSRSQGSPLRAIAAVFRRSPRVYIALAESGIRTPYDFVGKTISVNLDGLPLLQTMMQHVGISPEQYRVIENTSDLQPLYSGEVDVRSGYLTNEVISARNDGYEINVIYPDDYGIHNYADTIVTTDETIAANPDQVFRFLRATLKGWTFAVDNPTTIAPMVQTYTPQADVALETAKMIASIPLINTGEDHIGWMKAEIWIGMEQAMRAQGMLTQPLDVAQVYTMRFLNEIYER